MLSRRTLSTRIPSTRPLRPPNRNALPVPAPRLFTQNSQLLLIARHSRPRPELPYLSQPAFRYPLNSRNNGLSQQIVARLLSTEVKVYVKEQAWLAVKWSAIGWVFLALGTVAFFGLQIETQERLNPTPDEWKFWTRQNMRWARWQMDPARADENGFIDWPKAGGLMLEVVASLEDRNGPDGKGVELGGEITIPGVGVAGHDISSKSWPWRAGYYEAIMSCAKAAEHLDDMVSDRTRGIAFPKEAVIGPSNPTPRPIPSYLPSAPLEENCDEAFLKPDELYMRVLTTIGFTTKQKLDAALAYANWLELKGLKDSAEEMYKWGVDIAKGPVATSLPPNESIDKIVDSKTNVLNQTALSSSTITPNLLRASTDLAAHFARKGDTSSALPIFLSVLRARRTALPSSSLSPIAPSDPQPVTVSSILSSLLKPPSFPPPPPTGDDPLLQPSSPQPGTCEESELMLYIGEILFATSSSRATLEEGLCFTQKAVSIAEQRLAPSATRSQAPPPATKQQLAPSAVIVTDEPERQQRKCKECLLTGVGNWEKMLLSLQRQGEVSSSPAESWKEWLPFGSSSSNPPLKPEQIQSQLWHVEGLKARIVRERIAEQVQRANGVVSQTSSVWMG